MQFVTREKRISKRKLAVLFVNGSFTEDRTVWKRELQRHCEEVYVDPGETIEEQEKRIMKYKKMVRNILQKKGVCLKSPLSWYFRQGPRWPTTESMDQKTPL